MFKKLIEDVKLKMPQNDDSSSRKRTSSTSSRTSDRAHRSGSLVAITGQSTVEFTGGVSDSDGESDVVSVSSSVLHHGPDIHELQTRFQRVHQLARFYKAKSHKLSESQKHLETENDRLQELLNTSQCKTSRQIDELREQLQLDKKAKEDVDNNCRLLLAEKEELVKALRLEIVSLKVGNTFSPELEAKSNASHEVEAKETHRLEEENRNLVLQAERLKQQLEKERRNLSTWKELERKNRDLEKERTERQLSTKQDTENVLRIQLTDCQLSRSALEEQVGLLKTQMTNILAVDQTDALKQQLKEANNQLSNEHVKLRCLQSEKEDLERELWNFRSKFTDSSTLDSFSNNQIDKFDTDHPKELGTRAASHDSQYHMLQNQVTSLVEANGYAQSPNRDLDEKLKSTSEQLEKAHEDLATVRQQLSELTVERQQEIVTLSDQLKALQQAKSVWINQLDPIRSQVVDCRHQLTDLRSAYGMVSRKLWAEVSQLVADHMTGFQLAHALLKEENKRLCLELDAHRTQMQQLHYSSQSDIAQLQSNANELKVNCDVFENTVIPNYEKTIAELRSRLSQAAVEQTPATTCSEDILLLHRSLYDFHRDLAAELDQIGDQSIANTDRLDCLYVQLESQIVNRLTQSETAVLQLHEYNRERQSTSEAEISTLQQNLSSANDRLNGCNQTINRLVFELGEANAKIISADAEISNLAVKLSSMVQQRLIELRQQIVDLLSPQPDLQQSLLVLLSSIQSDCDHADAGRPDLLCSAMQQLDGRILPQIVTALVDCKHQAIVDACQSEINEFQSQLQTGPFPSEEQQEQLQELCLQNEQLRQELSAHLAQLLQLKQQVNERDVKVNQLLSDLERMKMNTDDASVQHKAVVSRLQQELDDLKEANTATIEKHRSERENWHGERHELQLANKLREEKLWQCEEVYKSELFSLQQKLTDFEAKNDRLTQLETELSARDCNIDYLNQRLTQLAEEHATCAQSNQLAEHLKGRDAEIARLIDQLNVLREEHASQITEHQQNLEIAESKLAQLFQEKKSCEKQLKVNLQAAKEHFEAQCEANETVVQKLNHDLDQLQVAHQKKVEHMHQEFNEFKTQSEICQQNMARQLDERHHKLDDLLTSLGINNEDSVEFDNLLQSLRQHLMDYKNTEVDNLQKTAPVLAESHGEKPIIESSGEFVNLNSRCNESNEKPEFVNASATMKSVNPGAVTMHSTGRRTDSASQSDAREKQLKQQLREVKQRLKQVLQESETLRKSAASAVNNASENARQLQLAENQLANQKHESEQLGRQANHLINQLNDAKQTHTHFLEELKEQYLKDIESLKEEHGLHVYEMQKNMEQDRLVWEGDLRSEFEKQLSGAQNQMKELHESHINEVKRLTGCITTCEYANAELQNEVDRLTSELRLLQTEGCTDEKTTVTPPESSLQTRHEQQRLQLDLDKPQVVGGLVDKGSDGRDDSFELINPTTSAQVTAVPEDKRDQSTASSTASLSVHATYQRQSSPENSCVSGRRSAHWIEQLRNQIIHSDLMDSRSGGTVSAEDYEALRLHNVDLQNQLHQFAADFEALCARCASCNRVATELPFPPSSERLPLHVNSNHASSAILQPTNAEPTSPSSHTSHTGGFGALHEMVEYEYLKNVLYQYMVGCETHVLSKVLCSIMRFEPDQVKQIMHLESVKRRTWSIEQVIE